MSNTFIYHANDVIRSFTTDRPRALIDLIPSIVTTETSILEALDRLFVDGFADVLVLDAATGSVAGVLSNFETTTTLSSKKKKEKKAKAELMIQAQCHEMCVTECENRGGCKSHGVADYGGTTGLICTIICNDEEATVGEIFTGQTLPD